MQQHKVRVRVYELVEDGHWKDKGTGKLFVVENQSLLVVSCEETEKEIISHTITSQIDYELQGESIITWVEPPSILDGVAKEGIDLALSFQNTDICATVWGWITDMLASIQQEVSQVAKEINVPAGPSPITTNWSAFDLHAPLHNQTKCPKPTVNNLATIISRLTNAMTRDGDVLGINEPTWFNSLHDVLKQAEDFGDFQRCTDVWRVLKETIQKGDKSYMDHISSSQQIRKTIHMAEYHENLKHEDVPKTMRDGLEKSCKMVLPGVEIPSEALGLATRLYELIFLRNVCLLTLLEEQGQANLNHSIYHVNFRLLKIVIDDDTFLENVHKRIKLLVISDLEQDYEDLVLLVSFLRELVSRIKEVQFSKRRELYKKMVAKGVLDGLYRSIKSERVCPSKQSLLWTYVVETVGNILYGIGVAQMKAFCVTQNKQAEQDDKSRPSLLGRLVESLGQNCEEGLQYQIAYLIRCILVCQDPNTPEHMADFLNASPPDIEGIWQLFHEKHIEDLVSVLMLDPSDDFPSPRLRSAQNLIINILRECINRHNFSMKHSVHTHCILEKASNLIFIPEKRNCPIPNIALTLSVLRLFRACIKPNDDYYIKRITQTHTLDNCVKIFVYNGKRKNLLNSTFLSIYDALLKCEGITERQLTVYLGKRYLHDLKQVDSVLFDSFEEKCLRFQNYEEPTSTTTRGAPPPPIAPELNTLPSDDESEEEPEESSSTEIERKRKDGDGFIEFVRAPPKQEEERGSPGLLSKKHFVSNARIKMSFAPKLNLGVKRKLDTGKLPDQKKLKL